MSSLPHLARHLDPSETLEVSYPIIAMVSANSVVSCASKLQVQFRAGQQLQRIPRFTGDSRVQILAAVSGHHLALKLLDNTERPGLRTERACLVNDWAGRHWW